MTRAKYKLIFIGDMGTVNNHKPFSKLFDILSFKPGEKEDQVQIQEAAIKTLNDVKKSVTTPA